MNIDVDNNTYTPDSDEITDAISFVTSCQASDLVTTWTKISLEWDVKSVIRIHKVLCDSGRINELIKQFE